jgi:hypothetical protein
VIGSSNDYVSLAPDYYNWRVKIICNRCYIVSSEFPIITA